MGSLRSLRREASKRTQVETTHEFLRESLGIKVKIPLHHPDYHFISIEQELSDPLPMPGKSMYKPNETYYWTIEDIEFRLGTYIGFTMPYINLQLRIKVPTRSRLCWEGYMAFFSKKVVLPGNAGIKKYYKFRDDIKQTIKAEGLLGLCEFPDGWIGHEVK